MKIVAISLNNNVYFVFSEMVSCLALNGNKVIDMILINMRRTLFQTRREVLELPPVHAMFMHKVIILILYYFCVNVHGIVTSTVNFKNVFIPLIIISEHIRPYKFILFYLAWYLMYVFIPIRKLLICCIFLLLCVYWLLDNLFVIKVTQR